MNTACPTQPKATADKPLVGLFVTCLADLFRPQVAAATVAVLERYRCRVEVPVQSCCGQPAYNSGERAKTRTLARNFIAQFGHFEHIVTPSGSCAAMIKRHYPALFPPDSADRQRALELAAKTWEISQFLLDVLQLPLPEPGAEAVPEPCARRVATYHDSCSGLRELGIRSAPRRLLQSVAGITLKEMANAELCCGFGGTFCVQYGEISTRMVDDKIRGIAASQCDLVIGGDLGCLMNIAGRLNRQGSAVQVRHYIELLAGEAE